MRAAGQSGAGAAAAAECRRADAKNFYLLQDNPLQVDQVIERSGLAPAQVLEILLDLELQDLSASRRGICTPRKNKLIIMERRERVEDYGS